MPRSLQRDRDVEEVHLGTGTPITYREEARRVGPNCTARCARWPNPVGPTNDHEDANSNDDDGTMTTMLG